MDFKVITLMVALVVVAMIGSVYGEELSMFGLHVDGRFIKNQDGKVVQLRGVNRPGTEYCCVQYQKIFDGPYDMNHIKDMKSWNINVVRVPLNEDCWLGNHAPASPYFGPAYRKAIIQYVNDITSNNMAVILDLHWSAGDNGKKLATEQIPMPNKYNAPTFWSDVAGAFKDNSAVLFDLYNEPYPLGNIWDDVNAWKCWRDGGVAGDACQLDYDYSGMQDLINAVRKSGSKNIVLVSGIQYATSLLQFLQYMPIDPSGQMGASLHSYDFNFCKSRGCWDKVLRPVFTRLPIVTTETGQKDCKTDFIHDFLYYCDQNSIHYLAWSWLVADCDNPSLIKTFEGEPTAYGAGVRNHLRALAEDKIPYHTDTFDMYNDKLTHWVDDWSPPGTIHQINSTDHVFEGKYSLRYSPKVGSTLYFNCVGCIQTSIHRTLELWLYGGASGNQVFDIALLSVNDAKESSIAQLYKINDLVGGSIPPNKWVKVIIDLSALGNTTYDGMWLQPQTDQHDIYIDKVTVRGYYDPPMPADEEESGSFASSKYSSSSFTIIIVSCILFIVLNLLQ